MKSHRILQLSFFLLLAFTLLGCDYIWNVNVSSDQEEPQQAQPIQDRRIRDVGYYEGTISAVGASWFELGAGWKGGSEFVRELDEKKPVCFSTKNTIVGGDPNGDGSKFISHVLADLKIGDRVSVEVHFNRMGENWTNWIHIERRPGGKIPPMIFDVGVDIGGGTHLKYQALQDWEEKGIPIPKKYLDKDGRYAWTNPPYPPVAPMPREVVR